MNYEPLFFDYVNETSLPKGVELHEDGFDKIYEYLDAIYTTIVEKDIAQHYQINSKELLKTSLNLWLQILKMHFPQTIFQII